MKITPGPFPSPEAATAWANAAMHRWTPSVEPISVAELFPSASGATTSEKEDEIEYLLTEGQALFLTICACGDKEMTSEKVKDICHDMVKVIMAWRRGKLARLNALKSCGNRKSEGFPHRKRSRHGVFARTSFRCFNSGRATVMFKR